MESTAMREPSIRNSKRISQPKKKKLSFRAYQEIHQNEPPTSYLETLMHLFKGNVGTGCFAMAEAMKHGGIIAGPLFTLLIAVICVHVQHLLIKCAENVMDHFNLDQRPDYAETVEMSFTMSKYPKWHRWGPILKKTCNVFICITQLGFCSVYFLFIGTNFKNVLGAYDINIEIHLMVAIVFVPILLTSVIRQLKYIAIFSAIANFFMIFGIILTVGYAAQDLPPFSDRSYLGKIDTLSLFFGAALFAFEGIALVLPLQNAMKNPNEFSKPFGVLNVGMVFITLIYLVVGVIGYWQYGEATEGSLTLNLPSNMIFAQVIKLMIATGVMLGYAIQLFVAVQIMFTDLLDSWKFAVKHPIMAETIFRCSMVILTCIVAEIVPNLSLLLSLIGSVCCVVLAFVFPVLAELIILNNKEAGIHFSYWLKNSIILFIALIGFVFGLTLGLKDIIEDVMKRISGEQ